MTGPAIDVLMYHSISEGAGPTYIAPATFRRQMAALAEAGYRAVSLADLAGWLRGEKTFPEKPFVLTFDDGYEDFASAAFPELNRRGWTATVFLPAARVGGTADWDGPAGEPTPRRLMSWKTVVELANAGIDSGAHGVSHTDLTELAPAAARDEVVKSKAMIEDRTGRPVTSFAAPFGRTNPAIRAMVRRHYQVAVGTRLAHVRRTADPYELPRIEMWYFRNPRRWQAYLQGGAQTYFLLRKMLRRARALVGPGRRAASPLVGAGVRD